MQLPICRTVASTLRFAAVHWLAILNRIILPILSGWVILYFLLSAYLFELERYLRAPDLRPATLVLGIAMAGILVALFLNAVVVIAVAELAVNGGDEKAKLRLRIARPERRFYAASLRVLLIIAMLLGAYLELSKAAVTLGVGPIFLTFLRTGMAMVFFYIVLRLCFLMAPVTLAEHGAILRRAWALSAVGHWRIMTIGGILALSGPLTEISGELIVRLAGKIPVLPPQVTMASVVAMFHGMLPVFLLIAAIAYMVGTVFFTAGSVYVYRTATGAEDRNRTCPY